MSDTTSVADEKKYLSQLQEGVGTDVIILRKADTLTPSPVDGAFEAEFEGLSEAARTGPSPIAPEVPFEQLFEHIENSNALGHLIESMVVNVDGTGFDIVKRGQDEPTDAELEEAKAVQSIFNEPWPKVSFLTQRKTARRHLESIGNAFIEVIRSLAGDIVFWRVLNPLRVRAVEADDPIEKTVTLERNGEQISVETSLREHRFVQLLGKTKKLVYFKEFGASRDLDRETGEWGENLPAERRATEILHLKLIDTPKSPYGQPRWYPQARSVIGSRKAEDLNIDYFDNGGIPPVMVLVSGGRVAEETVKQLQGGLRSPQNRLAVAVIHALPTGGSLDKESSVKLQIERFGSEQQQDALFMKYDAACEEKIRASFRLPPIFVGRSDDYTRATAVASYVVAEAQVFKPERDEFDEVVNTTLLREIAPEFEFVSRPLAMNDDELKVTALELVGDSDTVSKESFIDAVNQLTGLNLKLVQPGDTGVDTGADAGAEPEPVTARFSEAKILAQRYIAAAGLDGGEQNTEALAVVLTRVTQLSPEEREQFNFLCASMFVPQSVTDPQLRKAVESGLVASVG